MHQDANLRRPESDDSVRLEVSGGSTVDIRITMDGAAAARLERFGTLPERIRLEDTTADKPDAADQPERGAYNPEGAWTSFNCLAYDLGL